MNTKWKWLLGVGVILIIFNGIYQYLSSGSIYDLFDFIFVAVLLAFAVPAIIKRYNKSAENGNQLPNSSSGNK